MPVSFGRAPGINRFAATSLVALMTITAAGVWFKVEKATPTTAIRAEKIGEWKSGSGSAFYCDGWGACSMSGALTVDNVKISTGSTTVTAAQGLTSVSTNVIRLSDSFSGTSLEIMGISSGRVLYAADSLQSSGSLVWEGTASGAKLRGLGLTDCDTATTSKLLWDTTSGTFSCGTDTDTTGGTTAGQGLTAPVAGVLALSASFSGTGLEILGTSSGRVLHAQDTLESSGALMVDGVTALNGNLTIGDNSSDTITINGNTWTFANDTNFVLSGGEAGLSFDTPTFVVDATANRVGIGTATPDSTLEVLGVMSGSTVTASGGAVDLSLSSGEFVLVSSGTLVGTGQALTGEYSLGFDGKFLWANCNVDTVNSDNLTTIDIEINGTSIFTNRVTIDGGEENSLDAATDPLVNPATSSFVVGDDITFDVDTAGGATRAKGLKCVPMVKRTRMPLTQP